MIKNADQMFLALRQFLTNDEIDSEERRNVWDVLTALRGPDNESLYDIKQNATTVLRYALLGKEGYSLPLGADVFADSDHKSKRRTELEKDADNFHFYNHLKRGFNALSLKWNEENKEVPTFRKKHA